MSAATPPPLLIRGAHILSMDPAIGELPAGDVLVQDGRIAQVAPFITAPGVQALDARGMLLIPGLIDTHTHMWQAPLKGLGAGSWGMADYQKHVFPLRERFSPSDMEDACFACGVEMLDDGITAALDFCHNVMSEAHAERALQGHARTGQRVLFAYGMLGRQETLAADQPWRLAQVRDLHRRLADAPGLVSLAMAFSSLEYAGLELARTEIEAGRSLGLQLTFHQNPPGQIRQLHQAGLLGPDILPVHANVATDDELQALAACGAGISFTVEGEFGGGRPMGIIGRAQRAGVTPSLGGDIPSRVPLDLLMQMRLTFHVMRSEEAATERRDGRWPLARRPGTPHVEPRHLLEFVTVNAARALGMADRIGRVAPGLEADLVLLRTGPYAMSLGDPAAHVVLQASAADVDTVLVGGVVRKRGGRLLGDGREEAAAAIRRVRARVLQPA